MTSCLVYIDKARADPDMQLFGVNSYGVQHIALQPIEMLTFESSTVYLAIGKQWMESEYEDQVTCLARWKLKKSAD